MKETKGEEGVILVIEIKKEEIGVGEIERWVLRKKRVFPTWLCSSDPANFFDKMGEVWIFSIWILSCLCGEGSEMDTWSAVSEVCY